MMMHHYDMIMIMLMICIMYHHRRCKLHTEHSWRWSCCSRISIVTIPETPEARQCHQCQLWPGLRCVDQSEARMLTPDQSEGSILTYSRVTINTRHEWHLSIKYEALVNNYHTWHRTAYIVRCIDVNNAMLVSVIRVRLCGLDFIITRTSGRSALWLTLCD